MELPRVLIISDFGINSSHGTGTVVLRHFSGYPPEKIANIFYAGGKSSFENSRKYRVNAPCGKGFNRLFYIFLRGYNFFIKKLSARSFYYNHHWDFVEEFCFYRDKNFKPEIVYSLAYSPFGLSLVDWMLHQLPKGIPLIQYFMDYSSPKGFKKNRYLDSVLRHANEIWSLTEEIVSEIKSTAMTYGKKVQLQPAFHCEVPHLWKRPSEFASGNPIQCIVVGNFYLPRMAKVLKRVWSAVQRIVPGLGPIDWYCQAEGVKRVYDEVGELGPEIRHTGFFSGQELTSRLIAADIAILPFNAFGEPENDYARFSLPSRLTEILSVGLPLFCIASEKTPVANYLKKNNTGYVCSAHNEIKIAEQLAQFIKDTNLREELGARARRFAEQEFPLNLFQNFLYTKISMLSSK